jgi:hypothetical protein
MMQDSETKQETGAGQPEDSPLSEEELRADRRASPRKSLLRPAGRSTPVVCGKDYGATLRRR